MPISLESPSQEEVAHFNKIVANAKRLAVDSQLLIDADRAQSAIMLSIFAIEELGKALILFWGVRNSGNTRLHPSHVEKQSATFALLASVEAGHISEERFNQIHEAGGGFHEMGPLSSQFAFARGGFFDDFRMAATYADQSPKLPIDQLEDGFHVDLATQMLGWFELAGESIATNGPAMELAATIYQNDLGRM